MNYKKVLILGGTENAARLAFQISRKLPKIELITSLAGRTSKPKKIHGSVRNGGFGGPEGLAHFITGNNITLLIDATHPFSTRISENAIAACSKANVPRAILSRPEWKLPPKANYTKVRTLANAATAIDQKAQRVFLTTGAKDLDLFEPLKNKWFLIRLIEKPPKKINIENYKLFIKPSTI
jgi:Precorrin-6x reductase